MILKTYSQQPNLLSATCLSPGGCVKINISSVFRNAAFQSPTAAVSENGITQSKDVRMKETWRFQAIDSRSRRVPLVWRHEPVSSSLTLLKKLSLHLCIGANSWTSSETFLSNLHYESMLGTYLDPSWCCWKIVMVLSMWTEWTMVNERYEMVIKLR